MEFTAITIIKTILRQMNKSNRTEHMDDLLRFRITSKDKADIRSAAKKIGLNPSNYMRYLLIQNGVITP